MPKAILELEMPESCRKCKLSKWETWEYDIDTWTNVLVCAALGEECSEEGRRPDCPLKLVEDKEDENASLRNWNACEEKLHNELLESDKRRWELESELEDANNYLDKLRAHVARMRDALEQFKYDYEQNYPIYQNYLAVCQLLREDTVQAYHNPADVEALRKAREAIKAAWSGECSANKALDKASEALKLIDKAIGGKEDV